MSNKINIKNEILSGLTVALALVPEAIAFAFVAKVDPLVGLYAAFMMGLITSIFGGRPGMISGATGAIAVVLVTLVSQHGVEYLFATVILMGIIQMLFGVLRLGKFARIIPHPVMLGFVNGLAIVIFRAQLGQFKVLNSAGKLVWMNGIDLYIMLALVVVTMAIIYFLPKLTKAVPSSLVAIVTVTLIAIYLGKHGFVLKNVRDFANGGIAGGLPEFHIPKVPFSLETLKIVLPYAITGALVGLIESLLTLSLIDEITETRGRSNKECIGQGLANLVNGFFGGMGGCAMIGQSMINVSSGGRRRLSGITAALSLLAFIVFGSKLIEIIPLAALIGVMFMVVIGTFEWESFKLGKKVPSADIMIILVVTGVTVIHDLAMAVVIGIILSALRFAWEKGKKITVREEMKEDKKIYHVNGPLFFASVSSFKEKFTPRKDSDIVILDFKNSHVMDHSAIEAINSITEKYKEVGKEIHLRHLSLDCIQLLKNAESIIEVNIEEDPQYYIADDMLDS